jgi:hypothetical protein
VGLHVVIAITGINVITVIISSSSNDLIGGGYTGIKSSTIECWVMT